MNMNPDYQKRLEVAIDRELKELPGLTAPANLVTRVMRAIESRAPAPWYERSWVSWPLVLRVTSFAVLALLFAAICAAGWKLPATDIVAVPVQRVGMLVGALGAIWNCLQILLNTLGVLIKGMGTPVIAGLVAAGLLAYGVCIGLGTFCFRLATYRK